VTHKAADTLSDNSYFDTDCSGCTAKLIFSVQNSFGSMPTPYHGLEPRPSSP